MDQLYNKTTLGELIATIYGEFMEAYDDEHVAGAGTQLLLERLLSGVYAED
jgi:hypothetical protein